MLYALGSAAICFSLAFLIELLWVIWAIAVKESRTPAVVGASMMQAACGLGGMGLALTGTWLSAVCLVVGHGAGAWVGMARRQPG